MSKTVRILRVDPYRRTVATLFLKATRDCTPQLRRLTRQNNLGSRQIMEIDDKPLMCIAGLDIDEEAKGWRLRGGEDTANVAVLTGRDPKTGLLIDVPVSRDWLLARLKWLEGEDQGQRDARGAEMLASINDEIRTAIREAIVMPAGEIWLTAAHKAIVGDAMQTLGLGTERSSGQLLTKLGETVHDLLVAEPIEG